VSNGRVERVRVDMGEPTLEAAKIPTTLPGERIVAASLPLLAREPRPAWFAEAGLDPRVTCVSMGNPHAVLYCRHVDKVPLAEIGPQIEHDAAFPQRINVHFVEVRSPREVTMRTWERGSGITLACGTGASAVCVAGVLTERSERKIIAHLPGGDLELEWSLDGHVYMTGPAVEAFSGDFAEN
jgi:diaminopimelate epimerase